ncbi:pentapeptide repeat-containing protein [Chroococcidiopsis sp. CCMEE 29]|uniref:pentapeptide repeat-containing protein n=1 Tax=Chroococcidiopsis sp. CCMEE 29 TaxID=155894 RepID=UPI002020ACCF|nr:pentapeptide repeat-containing protein [Chroococcidiopsis sp. CCMEE 29]
MRIDKQRISALLKSLPLPLLIGVPFLLLLLLFWSVQQNNVNSLARQITDLKQQIDALPATVVPKDKLALEKDRVNAQNAIYGTLVQAVGGAFFFVTAYFTWRNVKAAEEKQVTERFSKAIEQLGNDNIHVRLGGIYALERIANDSDKDYWQVIEVLTAYVREKAPFPPIKKNERVPFWSHNTAPVEAQKEYIPPIPTDIQAVLTVLSRRRYAFEKGEKHSLDLNRTNLQGAFLLGARLQGAELNGANLQGAFLLGARLQGADLRGANLQGAFLNAVNLQGAFLEGANLQGADLRGANLSGANLSRARLQRATLNFANLKRANLGDANLEGAILKNVTGLDSVVGLTREQISQIDQDQSNIDEAMLPDYLRTPESSQPQPPDPQQT